MHRELLRVQHLAQGHFNMQTRGVGDQTTDLLVSRQPTLPPEQQQPKQQRQPITRWLSKIKKRQKTGAQLVL